MIFVKRLIQKQELTGIDLVVRLKKVFRNK